MAAPLIRVTSAERPDSRKTLTTGEARVLVLFVDNTADRGERHGRVLAELADLGMVVARSLAARCQAAKSDEAAQGLSLAFQRIARSVRLCLALESRLARERRQALSDQRVVHVNAVERRKTQVRAVLTRAAYDETEAGDLEALLDELDARLDEDALFDAFAEGPVEACIARIRADLGLPPQDPANDAAAPPSPRITLSG